jgi:Fe2+ or Zn2+ uptake regulation protein
MKLAPTASLDAALATVRARGLRASLARRVLLTALSTAERPVTAEAVARGLDGRVPECDVGSVYRNPDVAAYLACVRCGAVQPAGRRAVATVRAAVSAALGWDASFDESAIAGVCPDCTRRGESCAP